MKRQPLFFKIFLPIIALSFLIIIALTYFMYTQVDKAVYNSLGKSLRREARIIARRLSNSSKIKLNNKTTNFLNDSYKGEDVHLTIINSKGRTIYDSYNFQLNSDLSSLPEIRKARQNGSSMSARFSADLREQVLYIAILVSESNPSLIVRTGLPLSTYEPENSNLYLILTLVSCGLLLAACGIAYFIAKRLTKPIQSIQATASAFAEGDFDYPLPSPDALELRLLVHALKKMRSSILQNLKSADDQRKEIESILVSMRESIIAVDTEERILKVNEATTQYFDCPANIVGKLFQEVFIHSELHSFLRMILETQEIATKKILAADESERLFEVQGTLLHDKDNRLVGALLVIDDVTTIHRLETMRRDFVANVSHELRTPITAIKGCVETLLGGASEDPEDSKRFLAMMERQTTRLNDLVEDILSLSRIEKLQELSKVEFISADYSLCVRNAIQDLSSVAEHANIKIESELPKNLPAVFHKNLMERAVSNLISNAIKYGRPKTQVKVSLKTKNNQVIISVTDEGIGIAKKHFARLFERFYRIDSGRSRSLGGTGLGLAIVKHVAQLHRGSVSVDSVEGKGSTFTIRVPLNPSNLKPQLTAA